jgi:hypothetical protein
MNDPLNKLNNAITLIQQTAVIDGITIAGLMIVVYAILTMFNHDNSPAARAQRWENLQRVMICSAIIAGAGALVQFSTGFGRMLL